ncbi:Rne/Rng family ribonuclease [Alkalihalobacillus sp. LMS39]|uniref:Rne/Rng family ribonuclease n=1 Tax=Alkalihalobacillus sp. LMS39 TaxID=2924032 RepID=UPI001FB285DB|nr:Rne/Rng family ribonuclease [Alkalihalobacillus sp. LMS39]UOE93288.1 Rne/Rng family ribonuclease [Alkalihalobacillus sp. LMS39]
MKKIVFNMATTERRAAILEHDRVVELLIERSVEDRVVANVYKGRVVNVLPGMQAAFVNIGRDKNGFLYRDDLLSFHLSEVEEEVKKKKSISEFVSKGEELLVQVTKEGFGTKGPRLTGVVSFPGRYIVYMPQGGYVGVSRRMKSEEERERLRKIGESLLEGQEGMIIRTVCEGLNEETIKEDLQFLRKFWLDIWKEGKTLPPPALIHQDTGLLERIVRDFSFDDVSEIIIDSKKEFDRLKELLEPYRHLETELVYYREKENIFSKYGIEKELEKALRRQVWLKNGAYIMIDQTEALTVIDVNTGKFTGKSNLQDTVRRTNLEAAREIARQLRLRDISGIIIIDFIDMRDEDDKRQVLHAFTNALQQDRTKTNVMGLTGLGLVEMTRKKIRQNLLDSLSKPCPTCAGKGTVLSNEAQAYRIERTLFEYRNMDEEAMLVELPPQVDHVIRGEKNEHLLWLEQSLGYQIYLVPNDKMAEHDFAIRHMGTNEEVKEKALNLMYNKH